MVLFKGWRGWVAGVGLAGGMDTLPAHHVAAPQFPCFLPPCLPPCLPPFLLAFPLRLPASAAHPDGGRLHGPAVVGDAQNHLQERAAAGPVCVCGGGGV